MIVELTLVFDTEDYEDGDHISLDEINQYAKELNLDTASSKIGYQGYRVENARPPHPFATWQEYASHHRSGKT